MKPVTILCLILVAIAFGRAWATAQDPMTHVRNACTEGSREECAQAMAKFKYDKANDMIEFQGNQYIRGDQF